MDLSHSKLDQKNTELAQALAAARPSERDALIDKLRSLNALQQAYEKLCSQFEALFETPCAYVDIEITQGALSQHYINLRDAVSAKLIAPEQLLHISFSNTEMSDIVDVVRANGYLRNRGVARRFYEACNIRQPGGKMRFTRTGSDTYTLELLPGEQPFSRAAGDEIRRQAPFRFSECGISAGEKIVSVDDPSIVCTVCDDRHVMYDGRRWSLSTLAQEIRGTTAALQGPRYFTWHGTLLNALRRNRDDMER